MVLEVNADYINQLIDNKIADLPSGGGEYPQSEVNYF